MTPLHLASYSGQVDVARKLIERGADSTAWNNDGETLHLASAPSLRATDSRQKYAEVASMLFEYGADINSRDKNGLTGFVLASQHGNAEIMHILVEHGADSGAHVNASLISSFWRNVLLCCHYLIYIAYCFTTGLIGWG